MSTERDEVNRTEAPSARWRAHAQAHGSWPCSRQLITACTVLAGVLTMRWAGPLLASDLQTMLRSSLQNRPEMLELADPVSSGGWLLWALRGIMPFLLIPAAAAAVVGLAQTGFRFRVDRFSPSFERFSCAANLRPILSGSAAKISLISVAEWSVLLLLVIWWFWCEVSQLRSTQIPLSPPVMRASAMMILRLATKLAFVLVLIGLADLVRAWAVHFAEMRMSRSELVAEMRETEGDPINRRRRSQQRTGRMVKPNMRSPRTSSAEPGNSYRGNPTAKPGRFALKSKAH